MLDLGELLCAFGELEIGCDGVSFWSDWDGHVIKLGLR